MAELNQNRYSTGPLGNFAFNVKIFNSGGEELKLMLPVNAVRGLNDGTTNVIMHRSDGLESTYMTPYSGLTTADAVTLEGSCLYYLSDVKELRRWRDEVAQKIPVDIGGAYRDMIIVPAKRNEHGQETTDGSGNPGVITLINCLATKLTISDFDEGSAGFLTWTLEVRFERLGDI